MLSGPALRRTTAGAIALAGTLLLAAGVAAPARAAGTSTSAADENWLMAAHQSNLAEVAAGRDAQRFGDDRDVRNMGDDLVDDHQDLDKTVSDLGRKYDVFLPPLPNDTQRKALDSLQNKEGTTYDAAWVRNEIAQHKAIKAAGQKEIANGEANDVVAAAREAAPVIQKHLDKLTRIAADIGVTTPARVTGGTGGQAAAAASAARERPAMLLTGLGVVLLGAATIVAARRRRAAA
jgi:putative membrane protein